MSFRLISPVVGNPQLADAATVAGRVLLGTCAVIDGLTDGLADVALMAELAAHNAWCPVVWLCRDEHEASVLRGLQAGLRFSILVRRTPATVEDIRRCVHARPAPTVADVAATVARAMQSSCSACLAEAMQVVNPSKALQRELRRHQLRGVPYWRALRRTIELAHHARLYKWGVERTAQFGRIPPRSLLRWCSRLYGCGWVGVYNLHYWEAMIACAHAVRTTNA